MSAASADVLHQDLPWGGTLPQVAPSSKEAYRRIHFCLSSRKSFDDGIWVPCASLRRTATVHPGSQLSGQSNILRKASFSCI